MVADLSLRARAPAAATGVFLVLAALLWPAAPLLAQGMQPGEAFVTRFSGTKDSAGALVIDVEGVVGSIMDLRRPARAPQGQHWVDKPQRSGIFAEQVGQIFGVVLDDANPPNIYVAATAAFGL